MECQKCGGDMWDNRVGKKNPKAPDYKCKDKNCDGVIWPPKGRKTATDAQPSSPVPRQQAVNGGGGTMSKDDYWTRREERDIVAGERQNRCHAQDMALRYLELKGTKEVPNKELVALIDWWQRDSLRPQIMAEAKKVFNAAEPTPEPETQTGVRTIEPDDDPF
jgi:hypothetical protein